MGWLRRFMPPSPYDPESIEQRSMSWSIGDPATAELLGLGVPNLAGVSVGETSVLGLSTVWRCVSLISGAIGSLPLRTLITTGDTTQRVGSWLDTPGGTGPGALTPFAWKETVAAHLATHGNAFLLAIRGGAGQLVGLQPIHPSAVAIDVADNGTKIFKVSMADGTRREFDNSELTHIMGLSLDGIRGLSPISPARNLFGTSIAAERSAARLFSEGALVSGLVTPEQGSDLTAEEAKIIKQDLRSKVQGVENAGGIAVINRTLKFQQWSLSAEDAQWIQSRGFQTEEIGRWFGVPSHLIGQSEKESSWGTGIAEMNRGLVTYTLSPYTNRITDALTPLLTGGKKVEFDFKAMTDPSPETLIPLLIQQVQAGLVTTDEARKILNLPPLTKAQKNEFAASQGLPPHPPPGLDPSTQNGNGSNGQLALNGAL